MPAPLTNFSESTFPPDISRGATVGPTFRNIVITTESGLDQRIETTSVALHRFQIQVEQRSAALFMALKAFFLCRHGKSRGFRFKDWSDYTVTNEPLLVSAPGNPVTGAQTVQLVKSYSSGSDTYVRNIYKPTQAAPPTLRKNGSAFAGFTQDTTTGLVTLNAVNAKAITAITQAASAVVTVGAAHGFATNDLVAFSGVVGMTAINGLVGTVTATASTTITVNVATTGFGAYVSGGTATKYLTTTDTLDWTGSFEVPVRLDTDEMMATLEDVDIRSWTSIAMIELLG